MSAQELTERQQTVLRLIVQQYIQSATPVSSKSIIEDYNLGVSSATVRNEMAILEEKGYLIQPHTSAGRIPTEAGYRYFVEKLMEKVDLTSEEQRMIGHQFHQARLELDQWLRLSAAVLAHTAHNASLVTAPKSANCHLKHIELIAIREQTVLLILVFQEGTLKQQVITFESPVNQDELGPLARQLTDLWQGLEANEVAAMPEPLSEVGTKVSKVVVETMRRLDARRSSDIYRDGLLNVFNQPEFKDREGIRQIIRALEERRFVEQLVDEALQRGGVQIIIGGEGKWQELSDVGIVLTRYGAGEEILGVMGVLGPVRMPYERTVSVVRYMSRLMSDFVSDLYS
jgi:heat-inducible transcriptional repressor